MRIVPILCSILISLQLADGAEFTKASALTEVKAMTLLLTEDAKVGEFLKQYVSPDDMPAVIRDQNTFSEMEKTFAESEKRTLLLGLLKGLTEELLTMHEDSATATFTPTEGGRPLVLQFKDAHWYIRN